MPLNESNFAGISGEQAGEAPANPIQALSSFVTLTRLFHQAILELELQTTILKLKPLTGREWFDVLVRKLLPQLAENPYLVVAVVGGTNIGKSVIFNHIAGFRASSSSPLASGTKHPVCLVPTGFTQHHDLQALFPSFELRPWTDGSNALADGNQNCLFWRTSDEVPPNLLILDTPDVDSDAPINWQRADAVRQSADVIVTVLTQQKYNDAAVKQFFRKAANEEKASIVVFNQVELPDDEPYWPIWLQTFCLETGLQPEFVYLAPNDRKAAEAIQLSFTERNWPAPKLAPQEKSEAVLNGNHALATTTADTSNPSSTTDPTHLRDVLSQLRFAEIKLRTMRGSLKRLVAETDGAPAYLREMSAISQQFRDAAELLASRGIVSQANWPAAPNALLVHEMWDWWHLHRETWTSNIHGFYSQVGRWMSGGVQVVRDRIWGPPPPPLEEYRQREWAAIVRVIQQVYDQLRVVATLGNELLADRLNHVLAGTTCESLLERLRREHEQFDFEQLARTLVETEMTQLKDDHQDLYGILRNADRAAAVVRPALTFLLALGGGMGADHLMINATSQSVTHIAIEATAAAGTTVAGEAVVDKASGVLGRAKAWVLNLHDKFKTEREVWLVGQLNEHLLGELLKELQQGAGVSHSPAYLTVKKLISQFEDRIAIGSDKT